MSVVRCVSMSNVTITTAALASTRSSSRTSDRIVDPGVHRVGLLPVVHRRQEVDVGACDDMLAPGLAAGVHVHQVADAGLLEVLEEHSCPCLTSLIEVPS